jgi:hypothetical protein
VTATLATVSLAGSVHGQLPPPQDQEATEVHGLRARPDLPVRSLSLLPSQRAHHPDIGLPPGRGRPKCDKDIDITGHISGVTHVAAQDNTICTSADIDVYVAGSDSYVVQAGGEEAAWTHTKVTKVTDPANPVRLGQFKWSGRGGKGTYTPDIKAFRQGSSSYVAMGLERTSLAGYCGVAIVDVTNPVNPTLVSQFIGTNWCDTHNVFVENDGLGDGQYIYATADATSDMRVLNIKGGGASPANPIEIGRYTAPTASSENYVHDITVINHSGSRRAYLAYWDSGVVIVDAAHVTPGTNPTPLVGPNVIDPPNFKVHHAYPNAAGTRVFIQDEMTYTASFEPVQMWDISGIGTGGFSPIRVAGIAPNVGKNGELLPAHNLHVDGTTLYVGWYKAGLQAFTFTDTTITRSKYQQVQTEAADNAYDGAWGVRLLTIGSDTYIFQSDRRYGLIIAKLTP